MVSDLIDVDTWMWRRELVHDTFILPYAEAILNILLPSGGGDDFVAWAHDTSGNYTVKSASQALMIQKECQALEEGQDTGPSIDNQRLWNALWKLSVMPKVRVFFWRVLRGILPDESTLKHPHLRLISLCKICLAMEKDMEHALLECSHAKLFLEEAQQLFDFHLP